MDIVTGSKRATERDENGGIIHQADFERYWSYVREAAIVAGRESNDPAVRSAVTAVNPKLGRMNYSRMSKLGGKTLADAGRVLDIAATEIEKARFATDSAKDQAVALRDAVRAELTRSA
jgi:hypothetical protein